MRAALIPTWLREFEKESGYMKCEKCGGKGFIEYESGLIMVGCENCKGTGKIDDSSSGIKSDNQLVGSPDTGKSKFARKRKKSKVA